MTHRVLVIDDDAAVRTAATQCLASSSYELAVVPSVLALQRIARSPGADLIVIGVAAAAADATSALRQSVGAPVVPLFRPSLGAGRPVRAPEFGSGSVLGFSDCRIRIGQHLAARARRSEISVRWGEFTLKLEPADFSLRGEGLGLTRVQAAILTLLMSYGGEIVSRRLIETVVFKDKPPSQTNFISVHMSRLRARLVARGSEVSIETIKGAGYVLFWARSFSTADLPAAEMFLAASDTGEGRQARLAASSFSVGGGPEPWADVCVPGGRGLAPDRPPSPS